MKFFHENSAVWLLQTEPLQYEIRIYIYIFLYYISLPSILAQNMRFEFLIVASFRLRVFWNAMPSDLVNTYQHFREVTWEQRIWEFWYLSTKRHDVMAQNFFPNLFVVTFWVVSHLHCFPCVMCFVSQFLLCKSHILCVAVL